MPKLVDNVVELPIADGTISRWPLSCEDSALSKNWVATVLDKPSGCWPDTKLFWRNFAVPPLLRTGDVVVFDGRVSEPGELAGLVPRSWRWRGVVLSAVRKPDGSGTLRLRKAGSLKGAFTIARGISGPALDGNGLTAFAAAVVDGDLSAVAALHDWLEERGDDRAGLLRDEVLRLVMSLFPEIGKADERK